MSINTSKIKLFTAALVVKSLLSGLVFAFIIPHLRGAYFHGNYGKGVLFGALLFILHYGILNLVDFIMTILVQAKRSEATNWTLIVMIIVGCVLLPALELLTLAGLFPHVLGFSTTWAIVFSTAPMIFITLITRFRGEK